MQESFIKKLYDIKETPIPEALLHVEIRQSDIEKGLKELLIRKLSIEEVEGPVQREDFVVLQLEETEQEEAKEIQINVGKHFYDAEWEEAFLGTKLHEVVRTAKRDKERRAEVVQIKRRIFPELTDELMREVGLPNVTSVAEAEEQIRENLISAEKEKKMQAIFNIIKERAVELSVFEGLEKMIEDAYQQQMEWFERIAQRKEEPVEAVIEKNIPSKYDTAEKRREYIHQKCEKFIKCSAIGGYYAAMDGKELQKEAYEAEVEEFRKQGVPERQIPDYQSYLLQYHTEFFYQKVEKEFDSKIKVEVVE